MASHYLFEKFQQAGIENVFVVLREGKWDIPSYWGDGHRIGLNIAYLMMRRPYGTPFTLDQAYPFVREQRVAMGFPDILFSPDDAFVQLLHHQDATGADVVLGLFPARAPEKVDMVTLDAKGRPTNIAIKPKETSCTYTWICAVWTPVFTSYLHEFLAERERLGRPEEELYVGDVLQQALGDGLAVEAVRFPEGTYADIGTPDTLVQVLHEKHHGLEAPGREDS
ncbi:MAG: NDP-sugar synthase [Salinivenus sp.]